MFDIIMISLFVLFMFWIIRGFNVNQIAKHKKRLEDEEKNEQNQ